MWYSSGAPSGLVLPSGVVGSGHQVVKRGVMPWDMKKRRPSVAEPFGFGTVDEAIASTTEGLDFFMSHGITPRFTTWCPEPTTPLGKTNPAGAPLEYHIRMLEAYRDAMERHGLSSPPGYGPPGAGNAVFSVSSFMDTLPPDATIEANAEGTEDAKVG